LKGLLNIPSAPVQIGNPKIEPEQVRSEDHMRIKTVLFLTLASAALAMPAAAQNYARSCNAAKNSNQIGGAVLGSVLGGVLGSNVAAGGHRHDGTAVGAVIGGLVGAGVGGGSVDCRRPAAQGPLPPPPGTYAPGYGYNTNDRYYGDGYGSPPGYSQGPSDMYPSDPGYSNYGGYDDDRDYRDRDNRLYRDDGRSYNRDGDYAGRDCSQATQITRLPDGSVIRRPVEACRDAYYGDWQVRD
jgi:hypothetical protein